MLLGQRTQAPPLWKAPGGHGSHALDAVKRTEPIGQGETQLLTLTDPIAFVSVNIGQVLQSTAETLPLYVPKGHSAHDLLPVAAENDPAAHTEHTKEPTDDAKDPGGQGRHPPAPSAKEPGEQGMQLALPTPAVV